jgi:HrpA-like RNA helicase
MNDLDSLLKHIKQYNYKFLDSKNLNKNNFKKKIFNTIRQLFPKLNKTDINILQNLTAYLIEIIAFLMFPIDISKNYQEIKDYYTQFSQNDFRDTKSICLMILPFINTGTTSNLYEELTSLQQILFNKDKKFIEKKDIYKEEEKSRMKEFKFSNMAVSLFNTNNNQLLNLKPDNTPLIYNLLYHNLLSILNTLRMINGKLFINWINITPLNLENYKKSKIYNDTMKGVDKLKENYDSENFNYYDFSINYNGLWIGDFYNVFRMVLYQSIKKMKWLIFPFKNTNDKFIYSIQIIDHTLISISSILNKEIIDRSKLKKQFKKNINFIIYLIKSKNNYKNITYRAIIETYKYLLIWFVNNYKYKNNINNNLIKNFQIKEQADFENNEEINNESWFLSNITNEQIISGLEDIQQNIDELYDYLSETIEQFKNNFYASFLIKENNEINHSFENIKNLNLKNLYNYAKSLSILHEEEEGKSYTQFLPENFKALNIVQKENFLEKFFDKSDHSKWFRIQRNIIRQENNRNLSNIQINDIYNNIVENIKEFKFDLVFDVLIKNGLLTQFKTDLNLTDDKRLPKGSLKKKRKEIKKRLKNTTFKENKEDFLNSYYFLTNQKFKDLPKMRKENIDNPFKPKEKTYFENLTDTESRMEWFTFYAMDWIAQINFFNHYIHKQLILVTGSTGTGKSTQVPKLLTYALKMHDYRFNGRVVCTQPRIAPTKGNAKRISDEMGVQIIKPSKAYGKNIKTNDYYIQFKYKGQQHEIKNTNHIQLKMVTDGSLFEELFDNPMLKETKRKYYKELNKKEIDQYLSTNLYDIIIIDEAHEHNVNMDLILTKMRQHCYYNNSIRLVIISATMDDDEAIYRKYYRCLNDNLVYPIRDPLLFPFYKVNDSVDHLIDYSSYYSSLYSDRRFHISPPGSTTQYPIKEIYENLPENENISNSENAKLAQQHGYKIAIKIAKTTSSGQVLFFSTGQREILEAVEYLNKYLPKDIIALPFFTKMNNTNKDIATNITDKIKIITTSKNLIHKNWDKEYDQGTEQKGLYKRAIILATNVAEASITINGLKYVIDNGYEKSNNYNESTDITTLESEKISESSRLQRKGRVGRESSGTVYYLYKKGSREKIKPKYKIVNQNITENIIKLATKDSTIENSFLPIDFFKYILQYFSKNGTSEDTIVKFKDEFDDDYNTYKKNYYGEKKFEESHYKGDFFKQIIKDKISLNNNLINIIFNQFKKFFSDIIIKHELNNYSFLLEENYDNLYDNGYKYDTLLDNKGDFYIIHPQESKLIRNINRDIIQLKIDNKLININNIPKQLYANLNMQMLSRLRLIKVSDKNNNKYWKKTALNDQIIDFSRNNKVLLNENENLTLLLSAAHGSLDEMIGIIALLRACDYDIKKLVAKKNIREVYWDDFYSLYKNQYSDLVGLLNIFNNFRNRFKFQIFDINNSNYNNNKLKKNYNNIVVIYNIALEKSKNYLDPYTIAKDKQINYKDYEKLNQLKYSNQLFSDNAFYKFNEEKSSINDFIIKELNDNIYKIESWCNSNFLNFETFNKFIDEYQNLVLSIYSQKKNNNFNDQITPLEWMKKLKKSFSYGNNKNRYDHIIKPFIQARPLNISIKTDFNNNYYNKITNCSSNKDKIILNNFHLVDNLSYIFSYQSMVHNQQKKINILNIISNIDQSWLPNFFPFYYNPSAITKYKYHSSNIIYRNPTISLNKGKLFDDFIKNLKNNWNNLKPIGIDKNNLPVITEAINVLVKGIYS